MPVDSRTLNTIALAAVSFLRSIVGFGFPLFTPTMYQRKLGYGVRNTVLNEISVGMGFPTYVVRRTSILTVFASPAPTKIARRLFRVHALQYVFVFIYFTLYHDDTIQDNHNTTLLLHSDDVFFDYSNGRATMKNACVWSSWAGVGKTW